MYRLIVFILNRIDIIKTMKLLIVSQHFYPEPFRINDIAFSLAKEGHHITVLTGLPNYPSGVIDKAYRWGKKHSEIIKQVHIIRTPIIARGKSLLRMGLNYLSFALIGSLKAYFLKDKFDAIFVFQTSPVSMILPGIVVKHKQKIPLHVYCLDQWPISVTTGPIKEASLVYKLLENISLYHYKKADHILVSSKSFVDYFENVLNLNKEQYGLSYWPSYAEDVYGDIQSVDNDTFDLMFAGNVGPAQSVETIIEAAHLLKEVKNIQFHIIGDGLNLEKCKHLCTSYKLNNVIFYGHHPVEAMKSYYALADAFLITMVDNPVVNSTLPAKLQSYMRAAKPIIGAINGEVRIVVEEANCGWIGSALDAQQLSQNILNAYHNQTLGKQYGKNGLNYYHKHFDKEKQIHTLIQHLERSQ